ncbi:MAG: DUF4349 domain-containing protein [Candidatus Limiplasma sp.]|nr:DUF4349 domain-containing protein [Candidatus Limiplasma sp.]
MEKHNPPDALDRALTDLCRTPVPPGYRAAWRAAVQREEQTVMQQKKNHLKPFWRVALPVAAALVLVVGALSAGSLIPTVVNETYSAAPVPAPRSEAKFADANNSPQPDGYGGSPVLSMAMVPTEESAQRSGSTADTAADAGSGTVAASGVKIVRTADLTLATTAFDADTEALQTLTTQLGGYIASVSINGEASSRMDRVAYYSLRIPSDKLDAFLKGAGAIGRVTARSETATDQTTQYADTQLRLTTQQAKMTRLQELLKQAADVSDLLDIENEIADTQYQLDQLESSLRTIDRNVQNSDVSVTLYEESAGETAQAVELTLWQRLGSGLSASLKAIGVFMQNLLVFIVMALPVLVPLAALIALVVWLARKRRKAHDAQTPKTTEEKPIEKE